MDNPDLTESAASIDVTLKDILSTQIAIAECLTQIDDDLTLYRRLRFPPPREVETRDSPTWPWTPDTLAQGFLAGRWLRRDGNVYANQDLGAARGPNSLPEGGPDAANKVDVSSGQPRSGRRSPARPHHRGPA